MPCLKSHGADLYYEEHGSGRPFLFSHGLGGHFNQVLPLVQGLDGVRLILYDNRTHGRTPDAGEPQTLTFDGLADDAAAILTHLGISRAVIGGVSMGAGIALNLGLRHPELTRALVLSRPAWLDEPAPPNLAIFFRIADLVERFGRDRAREVFERSDNYRELASKFPAAAASLIGLFAERSDEAIVASLRSIPASTPFRSKADLCAIRVPVLVIGNHHDPVHPFAFAETLASALPRVTLRTVISKSENQAEHERQCREVLSEFLAALEA